MSLLMDALRKAEEAKKKAAQESQSEETVPVVAAEKQRPSATAEKTSEDASAPEIELRMEAIEEVPTRSAVPNLEAPIEFEDEEDYVLPTSVGAATDSRPDSDSTAGKGVTNDVEAKLEAPAEFSDSSSELAAEKSVESAVVHEAFDFDSFESEESDTSVTEDEAAPDAVGLATSSAKKTSNTQGSRVVVKVAEKARDLSRKRDDPERKTARNVFAAKQSSLLANRTVKASAGGAVVLVVIALATYFYTSLNRESTFNIPAGRNVATEFVDDRIISGLSEEPLSIDEVVVTEVEETAAINVVDTVIEPPAPEIVAATELSRSAANLQPEIIAPELPQSETVAITIGDAPTVILEPEPQSEVIVEAVQPIASVDASPTTEPTNLISFKRQETVVAANPNIDRAYTAYQQGSLDQAEALYRQTLARDPMQRDALLGLATIAARNGDSTEALDLYSRLLARNPSDPIARAGLMDILPAGSPSSQEAELKRLLNDHPNVAALSYAYGNFLASNQRWSEAQQAYFRALQLAKSDAEVSGSVNPDYAFNLAVSLEHLNQGEPAQNYYREALLYSANHPAGFDLADLRSRLASTSGNSNNE